MGGLDGMGGHATVARAGITPVEVMATAVAVPAEASWVGNSMGEPL